MRADSVQVAKKKCVDKANEVCVNFKVNYPVFTGGDSTLRQALNKSVQGYLLSVLGGNGEIPFAQALDSVGNAFIQEYAAEGGETTMMTGEMITEVNHKVSLLNAKVATVEMNGYSFTGGAHPNPFASLVTFDLSHGAKPVGLTDMVSDTNALRPILEKAYKLSKGLKETDPLSELVYPEITQLPMPANAAVVAEGIRFLYNAYEIAPYAVGFGDILLTWDQLGALAEKQKWMD